MCWGEALETLRTHRCRGDYDFTISFRFLGKFISTPCGSFEKLTLAHNSKNIPEMWETASNKLSLELGEILGMIGSKAGDQNQGRFLGCGHVTLIFGNCGSSFAPGLYGSGLA